MRSDRFYLNSVGNVAPSSCFSWNKYFEQVVAGDENIRCAVFATYRLAKNAFEKDMLNIYDAASMQFPVLVFHGDSYVVHDKAERASPDNTSMHTEVASSSSSLPIAYYEVDPQYLCLLPSSSQSMMGVHHPKYMLIFTDKGLHVIISTANLTYAHTVDGSWRQFFPLLPAFVNANDHNPLEPGFGDILQDFLINQARHTKRSEAVAEAAMDVLEWIERCTKCSSIALSFDFTHAEVELVSTVPGRYALAALNEKSSAWLYNYAGVDPSQVSPFCCAKCTEEQQKLSSSSSVRYGANRVQQLLQQLEDCIRSKIGCTDMLLVQPTSVSNGINNAFIADWLQQLMPEEGWSDAEEVRAEAWQLLWPSHDFIQEKCQQSRYNPGSSQQAELSTRGMLFLHPKTFALMEPDIQSQFAVYSANAIPAAEQLIWSYSPHIKTYTRLMASSAEANAGCSCDDIAWSLLTSACLSKGAQGALVPYSICSDCKHVRQGYMEYRNFELGVLFRSSSSRQYRSLDASCPVHASASEALLSDETMQGKEVYLPYPFKLRGCSPYCDSVGNLMVQPFFCDHKEARKYGAVQGQGMVRSQTQVQTQVACSKKRSFALSSASLDGAADRTITTRKSHPGCMPTSQQHQHILPAAKLLKAATLDSLLYCHVKGSQRDADRENRVNVNVQAVDCSAIRQQLDEGELLDIADFMC